jgi:hypothetical protein
MSSRQIGANRLNAKGSTGPRTLAGKTKVSMNAMKHGLTARDVILPNENPVDFESFRGDLLTSLDPRGELENFLAEKIATDAWRLRRVATFEASLYKRGCQELLVEQAAELVRRYESTTTESILESLNEKTVAARDRHAHEDALQNLTREQAQLADPTFSVVLVLKTSPEPFLNLWRHEAALSRSLLRNLHELERLQAKRAGKNVSVPAVVDVDVNVHGVRQDDTGETGTSGETDGKSPMAGRQSD